MSLGQVRKKSYLCNVEMKNEKRKKKMLRSNNYNH